MLFGLIISAVDTDQIKSDPLVKRMSIATNSIIILLLQIIVQMQSNDHNFSSTLKLMCVQTTLPIVLAFSFTLVAIFGLRLRVR